MKRNPFRYGIAVDEPYFTDREQELSDLDQWLKSGQSIVIYSPRRYGKTSLMLKLLKNLGKQGYKTIYVDFFKVHSRLRFIELYYNEILKLMPSWEKAIRKISTLTRNIKPVVSIDQNGNPNVSVRVDSDTGSYRLDEVFDLSQKLATKKPWIVVFDEFQEVNKLNGDSFEKEMRASLIHHDKVSYVFMGSQMHMLLNMFTRRNRAFYQFGKIFELKKIPAEVQIDYLKNRFEMTGMKSTPGMCQKIVEISNNIPHYVQYLASAAWESSLENNNTLDDSVLNRAINIIVINQLDYYLSYFEKLTPNQQKVLKAIHLENTNIFTTTYAKKYRLSSASSTQRAIERLVKDGMIEKQANRYHFTDPFFKIWLERM